MDELWKEILALLAAVILATIQLWNRQAIAAAAKEAKEERESVKATLETVTHDTDSKLNVIHDLVNKSHGEALRLAACSTARLARLTGDPDDLQAAREAKQLYDDYVARQALADLRQQNQTKETKR